MIDYSDKGTVWYAMQTTYKRELKAKAYLDAHSIECFVPMCQEIVVVRGKKRAVQKPILHNLLFLKADLARLKAIKSNLNYLHNRLTEANGRLIPIVVPTKEMEQFIHVATHAFEKVVYIDLSTTRLEKGTPVRVIGGDFEGYEGVLARVKGKRDKRVVINIEGVLAYALEVDVNYVEKIVK